MSTWRKRWPYELASNVDRVGLGWPNHVAPWSCLVASIGNRWEPGCFEAVTAMCDYTSKILGRLNPVVVEMYEENQRCFFPYDGLGVMRDAAMFRALSEGWEYLCYVDNDVKPPQDALWRLMQRRMPWVQPLIGYSDGKNHDIKAADIEPGQGLALISSTVISMVVVKTSVFLPFALSGFWQNPLGADEGYHMAKLGMTGIQPFIDSDVLVEVTKPPTYPLDWPARFKKRYRDFIGFIMDPATDEVGPHPLDGKQRRSEE